MSYAAWKTFIRHSAGARAGTCFEHFFDLFVYLKGTHAVDSGLAHDWLTMAPFR